MEPLKPMVHLWELNAKNKPVKDEQVVEFFKFVEAHPEWVTKNPEEAKVFFSHLAKTVFSKKGESPGREIQKTLMQNYPDFFPKIKVRMGSSERNIPIARLFSVSEKFKAEGGGEWKEKEGIVLDEPLDVDPELLSRIENDFLNYLEKGHVRLNENNVFHLLSLAYQHNIPSTRRFLHKVRYRSS